MTKTHDSLGRRMRGGNPRSTGKAVRLDQSDADLLYPILLHGPLSTKELAAFSGRKLDKVLRRTSTLYHELNNGYEDRLIYVPKAHIGDEEFTVKAHVFDLTPAGRSFLMDYEKYHEGTPRMSREWRHDRMATTITAWLDLSMRQQFDLYQPIYHHEVLEEIGKDSFNVNSHTIKPDRFFGARYLETRKRRFFVIEADHGTENIATKQGRVSIEQKLLKYERWFSSMQFRGDMPDAGVIVMFVTVSPGRMNGMIKIADRVLTNDIARRAITFNWMPGFKPIYKPQVPDLDYFTTPWARAGLEPLVMA